MGEDVGPSAVPSASETPGVDVATSSDVLGSRRRGLVVALTLVALLLVVTVASSMWLASQTPAAVALQPATQESVDQAASGRSTASLDERARTVTERLAAASGRSLESLAEALPAEVANPTESEAPTVAGAEAASEEFAETLAALAEAEAAAAQQLAMSEKELAAAEKARREASRALAKEEAAAAREIDAAIANAIAAAQATEAFPVELGADFATAAIPTGRRTSEAEILSLVRKHFPSSEVGNAMAVARCESGLSNAVGKVNSNGTRDFGVFQINDGGTLQAALRSLGIEYTSITQARKKALNPETNVRLARVIWDSRGWQPWTCAAKLKIVAGLYQRAPGSLYGQYDESGRLK